jgi:predicted nucleic acid-binding Zn ribbon protein
MRDRNRGFEPQPQNFYRTPPGVTKALLRSVRLPKGKIWEPCCGDGAIARVLESDGHPVVATDLMDRGYGEGGRDFLAEPRLPDGVTAIVTNPPYGKLLLPRIVAHALELTRPVGGMVALLVNAQWPYAKTNSKLLCDPAFDLEIKLTDRIYWFLDADGRPAALPDGRKPTRPGENHCWLVFDHSRALGLPRVLFADPNAESVPGTRWCIVCRKPLPLTARADKRHCSDTCRQRASRQGMVQRRTA